MQNKCVGVCDGARCRKSTANLLPPNCSVKPMENTVYAVEGSYATVAQLTATFSCFLLEGFTFTWQCFFFFILQGTQVVKKTHWTLLLLKNK